MNHTICIKPFPKAIELRYVLSLDLRRDGTSAKARFVLASFKDQEGINGRV